MSVVINTQLRGAFAMTTATPSATPSKQCINLYLTFEFRSLLIAPIGLRTCLGLRDKDAMPPLNSK